MVLKPSATTRTADNDILVAFDGAATSSRYYGVLFSLEDLLGCSVDFAEKS